MGSESKYQVDIVTTGDERGAKQTLDAIKQVADAADAVSESSAGDSGGTRQAQLEREAETREAIAGTAERIAVADGQDLATEERKASMVAQRQIIADQELAALEAEAAGEAEQAAALKQDVALRTQALALQKSSAIAEEEAFAMAQKRITAEAAITAQDAEQAALNAELVAQEEALLAAEEARSKIAGRGGQVGNALKNVGVDSGLATTIGIAVLAGTELNRQISEMAKAYDEARVSAEQQSVEYAKQVEEWKEMASLAQNMADVVKVTDSVNKGIDSLVDKLRTVKSEGSGGFLQGVTDGLKGWTNMLGDAYRDMLVNNGAISQSTADAIKQQSYLKTSSDEATEGIINQIGAVEIAGHTYENYAKQQAAWFQSLEAQPLADQLTALIEKEGELLTQQQGVAEGTKRWSEYQKQIDEVVKSEDKVIAASAKEAEQQARTAEAQKKASDQARKDEEAYQASLDKTIAEIKAKAEALGLTVKTPTAPESATSGLEKDLTSATAQRDAQTNATDWTYFDQFVTTAKDKLTAVLQAQIDAEVALKKPQPTPAAPGAPGAIDALTNRATPDADESDLQNTLNERAAADSAAATDIKALGAAAQTDTQALGTAATESAAQITAFSTAATTAFGTVQNSAQAAVDALALPATAAADAINKIPGAIADSTNQVIGAVTSGLSSIAKNTAASVTALQRQIDTLASQISMIS